MLFSKPNKAVGVDIGTHSVKAAQMSRSGGRLRLDSVGYALVDHNQMNVDPVMAQANAMRECLREIPVGQSLMIGALPGQTVVIRYPRLPDTPEAELHAAIEKEAGQHIPYDLSDVFFDWTLLHTVTQGNERLLKILLVAAKHEVIDSRVQVADAAEVKFSELGVDSLALADAAEGCDFLRVGETVALVNLGLSSTSIHFVRDGISNFIRDVSWGARELIQAILRARHCDYDQAEKILRTEAADGGEAGSAPSAGPPGPAPAAESPAAPLTGSSLLEPFEDELNGMPPPPPRPAPGPSGPAEKSLREVLATPLTRLVSEIRRSFDYYEHELYESPVTRLVLSGGVAHIPVLRETLSEELGIRTVEVANPAESALVLTSDRSMAVLRERPAQFMVAVGLAARGAASL